MLCLLIKKRCFSQLFGEPDDEDEVSPDFTDEENLDGGSVNGNVKDEVLVKDAAGQKTGDGPMIDNRGVLLNRINTRQWAAEHGYDPQILFKKVVFLGLILDAV